MFSDITEGHKLDVEKWKLRPQHKQSHFRYEFVEYTVLQESIISKITTYRHADVAATTLTRPNNCNMRQDHFYPRQQRRILTPHSTASYASKESPYHAAPYHLLTALHETYQQKRSCILSISRQVWWSPTNRHRGQAPVKHGFSLTKQRKVNASRVLPPPSTKLSTEPTRHKRRCHKTVYKRRNANDSKDVAVTQEEILQD